MAGSSSARTRSRWSRRDRSAALTPMAARHRRLSPVTEMILKFPRTPRCAARRSEEHTSELQSHSELVCRLLLEKKKYHETPPEHQQRHQARHEKYPMDARRCAKSRPVD